MEERDISEIEAAVWKEIATVEDPDLGLALTDLGLIYEVKIDQDNMAHIKMTLTSMGCPAAPQLTAGVHAAATRVEGIQDAQVEVVWTPTWNPREMASEEAQMVLGLY